MEFYRYEDVRYAPPLDEFDRPIGSGRVAVELRVLYLVKETPCGWWVSPDKHWDDPGHLHWIEDHPRWINKSWRKKYAYPTKDEAIEGFKARKRRQINILRRQLRQAEEALENVRRNPLPPR